HSRAGASQLSTFSRSSQAAIAWQMAAAVVSPRAVRLAAAPAGTRPRARNSGRRGSWWAIAAASLPGSPVGAGGGAPRRPGLRFMWLRSFPGLGYWACGGRPAGPGRGAMLRLPGAERGEDAVGADVGGHRGR